MDKNALRSFCVIYYIIPAVMYLVMVYITRCTAISNPICRFTVLGDAISHCSWYNIVAHAAISYSVIVFGDAISYRILLYRTR